MTGDQIWGMVAIIVGAGMIMLRQYIFVGGREVDRNQPDNNLANPNTKPTPPKDQSVVIMVGAIIIGAGLLYVFGFLPRE